jgi:hyaluronan synthase
MTQYVIAAKRVVVPLFRIRDTSRAALLLVAAGALLFVILVLKSYSLVQISEVPLINAYAIFLGVYQLSRLTLATLYRTHTKEIEQDFPDHQEFLPKVTFIIPCKNEEGAIVDNIGHCFQVDYPSYLLEVIVINDGSTDGTLKELRRGQKKYPELQVINFRKNRGKRHAMAAGVKKAQGQIVIQLDSDSYINPHDFRKLVKPFLDPKIGAVCAHAEPANRDHNLLTKAQAGYYAMAFRILKAAESNFQVVLCCSGCCSAYRRSAILPLIDQCANEKFLGVNINSGDDRSLTNLLIKNGFRTIYLDDVWAYTIVPTKIRQLMKQQVRWKKSWFANTVRASRYMWRQEGFVAFTYFYPLAFITFITPFMAMYGLFYYTASHHAFPTHYLLGALLVMMLFATVTGLLNGRKYWVYLIVWAGVNTLFLSYLLPYAILTIRDARWGTR